MGRTSTRTIRETPVRTDKGLPFPNWPSRAQSDSCAALVTDGDGTLTTRKQLGSGTAAALARWSATGRKLILATGESVKQLAKFPDLHRFDLVVAENGALLYWPKNGTRTLLTKGRPSQLVRALRRRKIPLTIGQIIIGTVRPHDEVLRATIEALRLKWRIIYNRKDVMALPAGVDKSSGVCAALKVLGLSSKAVVGIGDAENDMALLKCCGLRAAVGNAVCCLKNSADCVMTGGSGTGVARLIDRILGQSVENTLAT